MGSIAGRCHQTPRTRGGDRATWRVIEAKWPYGSEGAATDAPRGAPGATPAASRCLMHAIPNRLAVVATFLAAVAALGGLAVSSLYVDAPNWAQQARGTDLATLFLAVPVLAIGLWTSARGSSAGRLAVVAGLLSLGYNYAIFA